MKIRKGKAAKLLAVLLSLCLTVAFLPIVALAEGDTASISVTFRQGSEGKGNIEIYDGVSWRLYSGSDAQDAKAVRIRANEGFSVDWTAIALRVDGDDILTDDIRNQLVGDNGFTLTAGTAYALEEVEFRQGGGPNPSETHSIDFGNGRWTVGEQTVTANKSGTISELAMDEEIVLTGFNAETMQVKLVAEDGFTTTLTVTEGKTSLSAKNCEGLPDGTLTFSVEEKGGPGPEPGGEPAHGGYEGEEKTASFTVIGKADFYINDSRMVNANNGDSIDNIDYHYDGNGYVDFYFCCFIAERITELKINGVDYYSQLPTPDTEEGKAALLDACKGQLNEFKITVPYSESGYAIESNVKWLDDSDKDYMVVGNFLWTYEDENQGDDYIDHGIMELISVNYKDRDYPPEELNNPGTAFEWGQDEHGGSAVLPVGAVVTVKLIPDYGYQLTSFGINGGNFGTGDELSTFTFEIKPGNAHLGAHFTPVADKVTSSSDIVASGSIALGSDLSGGSAQLEISDAEDELSDEKLDAFETAAGNYTITDYLNLDLYNVYYKGTEDEENVWKNEVNTLEDDATISVSLADTVNPDNIVIIHNIHNGEEFETIPVDSYDSKTNTITFKTDSFSTYAIAKTEIKPVYNFLEGADSSWKQNSDGTLTFRVNGDFAKFTGVKVDGTLIDAKNYTAVSGSTVITLKTDYLGTLTSGKHTITVVYTDGECDAKFEVKKATSEQTKPTEENKPDTTTSTGSNTKSPQSEQTKPTEDNKTDTTTSTGSNTKSPQTDDNSVLALWFVLLCVSSIGILGTTVYNRKKNA